MGHFISHVPKIDYAKIVKSSTKKEPVKFMVRIDDTVVVEKENGDFVVLYQHEYKTYDKAAYIHSCWNAGIEKILKCLMKLGRCTKDELQEHFDAINNQEKKNVISRHRKEINSFADEFELTDVQRQRLLKKADNGDFVNYKELYKL